MLTEGKKSLKMVTCGGCGKKNFIPSDLAPLESVQCVKCGHPVIIPLTLRQFELREYIASGGMGTVYRSFDTTLNREVAVKLMKKEMVRDPQAVEQFAREARACAKLNHTNIIHIYTFEEWEDYRYLVMELANCGSLDTLLEKEGKVDELRVLDIGIKIASGLDTALKHKLLHLDIKPGNILFNDEVPPEPKLVDFGLAQTMEAEKGDDAPLYGTPYYIAPERVSDRREDFRSDMYSLAGTMYHALTGHVPFEAPTIEDVAMAHVDVPLTPPNAVNPEVTEETSAVVSRAMAKDPNARYQSYPEFIMDLEGARSHLLVKRFRPGS